MNLNATPETIHAIGKACELAALLDERFSKADPHRLAAWAQQTQRHNLTTEDLLNAVEDFYDTDKATERPLGIADLIKHARINKRNRLDHQQDTEEPSQTQLTTDDDLTTLTADAIQGRAHDTPRLKAARQALHTCHGRQECAPAITEYQTALKQARKQPQTATK